MSAQHLIAALPGMLSALHKARECISTDRVSLGDCHTGPDGLDEDAADAMADYDAALAQIDAAIAAATGAAGTRSAVAGDPLTALRRKLERWELDHLRQHIEELRDQLEAMTDERDAALRRANYAEDLADSWRDDALRLIEDLGADVGITQDGEIVPVPREPGAAS